MIAIPKTRPTTLHWWLTAEGTDEKPFITFQPYKINMDTEGWVYLGETEVVLEVPQGANVEAARLQALNDQLAKIEKTRNAILDQIRKYTAIEMAPGS